MSNIRPSTENDLPALRSLYSAAFPDEDLLPLVERLLAEREGVRSLVIEQADMLAGHVAFTRCAIHGSTVDAVLLGPLAIAPKQQRLGLGTNLLREGMRCLHDEGTRLICVLGDPAYYRRFSFEREDLVKPPYPLPKAWASAWQSIWQGPHPRPEGSLVVPPPWQDPALWS